MLAPILLFTFNRLEETKKTVESLSENFLASESELFIFSDGPKNLDDELKVKQVRNYLKTIEGFKSIHIIESSKNKGLANSIIKGVTEIIQKQGKVIVLEDDLITAPNFLDFMNQALDFYQNNTRIHSISGYTFDLSSLENYPDHFYYGHRASSWGWATWENRWKTIDWKVKDYKLFKTDFLQQIRFMRGGSDLPRMLKNQMKGKIDSWAIRWCFNQFLNDQLAVFPAKSKVINIGIGPDATHTKKTQRFDTKLDISGHRTFYFNSEITLDKKLIRESRKKFSPFSRIKDKLLNL